MVKPGLASILALLAAQPALAANAASPIAPVSIPTLIVNDKSSSAEAWLSLPNNTGADARVHITVSDFINKETGGPLNTQTEFNKAGDATGAAAFDQPVKAGESLAVRILVKNLRVAGESNATLNVNGVDFTLQALLLDVPFNTGLAGDSADKPVLVFERGRGRQILLKNDDNTPYPIKWKLVLPHVPTALEGSTTVPPKSSVPVTVAAAPEDWFIHSFEGLFRDEVRSGYLTLQFAPTLSTAITGLPSRTIPVEVHLAHWESGGKIWIANGLIFLFLLLGGLCSLYLSLTIPNELARIELKQKLDNTQKQVRDLSSKVDVNVRVALGVERSRLVEAMTTLPPGSPETSDRIKKVETEVAALQRRIEIVTRLDEVVRQLQPLRVATSEAPPTRIDECDDALNDAVRLLSKPVPTDAELQAAETGLSDAAKRVDDIMKEDPQFAQLLAGRIKELREHYAETSELGKSDITGRMRAQLADLFFTLKDATFEDAARIVPGKYHWIDTSTRKLFVLHHYILRFNDTKSDDVRHQRVAKVEKGMVELLRLQNWNALELATSLRRQCEQDIFVEDIVEEIRKTPPRIEYSPLNIIPHSRVVMRLVIAREGCNESEARKGLIYTWAFDKLGEEKGPEITRYFREQSEASLTLTISTYEGRTLATIPWTVRLISPPPPAASNRAKVETIRLALALAFAVIALLAGARDQLLKGDIAFGLIAIFMLGFGADSIKNLITRRN